MLATNGLSKVCTALSDLITNLTRCQNRTINVSEFSAALVLESRTNHSPEEMLVARSFSATLPPILGTVGGGIKIKSFADWDAMDGTNGRQPTMEKQLKAVWSTMTMTISLCFAAQGTFVRFSQAMQAHTKTYWMAWTAFTNTFMAPLSILGTEPPQALLPGRRVVCRHDVYLGHVRLLRRPLVNKGIPISIRSGEGGGYILFPHFGFSPV